MDARELADVQRAALTYVVAEGGFAQVTTIDPTGYPVARTMSAFLATDWSVDLVQRRVHRRLDQWRRNPRTLVSWIGTPAPGASNERPHVFDLGLLVPRAVFVRGDARFLSEDETVQCYQRHIGAQRERGLTRAPLRTPAQVVDELVGVRVQPTRVRLEGFGREAQAFQWTVDRREEPE